MIKPKSGTGAKIALLAPTTTFASLCKILCHCASFCEGVRPECKTAAVFPKRSTIDFATCPVKLISGTR